MSHLKLFSGLLATACLASVTPALALTAADASSVQGSPLAQSAADLGGTTVAGQPTSTEDLVIEDLTSEQVQQMEAIFNTYQPRIDAATETYTTAAAAMLDLLQPDTPAASLSAGRDSLLRAESDLNDLIFERNLALREVLTRDQRQTINDYVRTGLGL